MLSALKLPAFRRLFAAYTLNELTFSIGSLALALLVYRRTHTAAGATGFFLCSQVIPSLLSPFLVARIDSLRPDRLLPGLYAGEAAMFAGLIYVAAHFSVPAALLLITVDGLLALSARTVARTASAGVTIPHGLLREGNALINAVFSICFMAGPALGAALVAGIRVQGALLVNAGLFIVIAGVVVSGKLGSATAPGESSDGRLRAAFRYVRARAVMRALIGLWALGVLFFTISVPVEILLAERTLRAGASGYAAVLSAWGAGSVLGSLLYARARQTSARSLITLGAAALGAGFLGMSAAPTIVMAAVASGVAGVGNGIEVVSVRTTLQELLDREHMTVVMSLNDSLTQGALVCGILLGGGLAGLFGPRVALAVAGVGGLLTAAAAWVRLAGAQLPAPVHGGLAAGPTPQAPGGPEDARVSAAAR